MIILPFVIYCSYYYYEMIRKAPFKFSEFSGLKVQYSKGNKIGYLYDSRSGLYKYTNDNDSIKTFIIHLPKDTMQAVHRKMIENLFFDMPTDMRSSKNEDIPVYSLEMNYMKKNHKILWDANSGNTRYNDRVRKIKKYLEQKINEEFSE